MKPLLMRTALLAAALQFGCATPAPMFQATWYLQEAGEDTKPKLYIALLNRSGQGRKITGIVINSPESVIARGWSLPNFSEVLLPPGGLLVREISAFNRSVENGKVETWPATCLLPTDIVVLFSESGKERISPAGLMPSALPRGWEACPP